jgi:hypothetical protein
MRLGGSSCYRAPRPASPPLRCLEAGRYFVAGALIVLAPFLGGDLVDTPAIAGSCYGRSCSQGFYCIQSQSCGGAATGACQSQGMVCLGGNCVPSNGTDPDNVCNWSFSATCNGPDIPTHWCVVRAEDYVAADCAPTCVWVSYNSCSCACASNVNGSESGCGVYCDTWTSDTDPCSSP